MALVNICDVTVLDNPSSFLKPFQFEITFECLEDLPEDLEWKIIYVGSAESMEHDQVLDTILVGPVPGGKHKFMFEAEPPDVKKIPDEDVLGVTVVLLTCSYKGKEFIRVGYYVNNEYDDPEFKENPPSEVLYDKLTRNILASEVRVTRFTIPWHDKENDSPEEENMETEGAAGDEVPSTSKISQEIEQRIAQDLAFERANRDRAIKVPFSDPANVYCRDEMRLYGSEDSSSLCYP